MNKSSVKKPLTSTSTPNLTPTPDVPSKILPDVFGKTHDIEKVYCNRKYKIHTSKGVMNIFITEDGKTKISGIDYETLSDMFNGTYDVCGIHRAKLFLIFDLSDPAYGAPEYKLFPVDTPNS